MAEKKKWVNINLMGYGNTAMVAETEATNVILRLVNELGLKGNEWKVIFGQHHAFVERRGHPFSIHFAVFTNQKIDLSHYNKERVFS